MRKTKTRLLSLLMLLVMLFGMLPTAYADPVADLDVGADVDVVDNKGTSQAAVIDSAPAQFNVIVPTKLPFAILVNNETLKATNAAIKNQGNGPVKLAGITAEGKGWAFGDYDNVDFTKMPMNSKVFTMQLNGDKVPEAAVDTKVNVPITQSAWASGAEGSIYGRSDLPISYDGQFAPQADASEEAVVAHVVFTIGWQTADDTNNGGDNQNNENDPVTNPDEKLAKPSFTTDATTFIYDGQPHFPDISTDGVVLDGETAPKTDVGTYTTTITPADGYAWDDGTKTPVTVEWEIKKADAAVDEAPTAKTLTYTGSAQELVTAGTAAGGAIQYKLNDGSYSTDVPTATDAGTYTVYYKVVGDDSHNDVAEKSVVVTIARKRIAMPTVATATTFIYDGQPHFPDISTDGVVLDGETAPKTDVGTYTTTITPADSHAWDDGTKTPVTVEWEIKKADSVVSKAPTARTLTYNGEAQELVNAGTADGGTMQYSLDNKAFGATIPTGTNAGSYTVYYKVVGDTNHADVVAKNISVSIDKAAASVSKAPTAKTLTYTGSAQTLVNAGTADGGTMQYKLNNGSYSTAVPTATNADSYTVYYKVVGDKNHNDTAEKSIVVTIARKRIAMPTVMTFDVDGEAHFPEYNYPAGSVTMSGTTAAQSAAGKYQTVITPTKNYAWTDGTTDAKTIAWEIIKPLGEFEGREIFGVKWDESNSSTALTRLTTANDPYHLVNTNITTEPVAAIEGSRVGSSPFDSYMPYAGMEQYNIVNNKVVAKRGDAGFSNTNGDTMVYIPEFYYKVVKDGTNRYFYLSNHEVDGFEKHPGSGNYVGRYATASGYVSQTGKAPLVDITRANARTGSMAKGGNWSQYDFATWQAIQYLYLIEYADWNSQARIGRGYVDNGSNGKPLTAGATNIMSYHTGRPAGTDGRTAVQYRWIENPWGNVFQFVDGINFNNGAAYISSNYKTYADDTTVGYIATEVTLPGLGYIKSFGSSTTAPWALIPSASGGSASTYVPDFSYSGTGWCVLYVGGAWYSASPAGLFLFYADSASSNSRSDFGARLLYHP